MNGLTELYGLLTKAKYYNKTYKEFEAQVQDPAYRAKLVSVLQRDGLMSDGFKSVLEEGGAILPKSNKSNNQMLQDLADNSVKKKDASMESSLDDGSSAFQGFRKKLTEPVSEVPISDNTQVAAPKSFTEPEVPRFLENELQGLGYIKSKGTVGALPPEDITSFVEEYVVPKMNYQFGALGFKFEESGMLGDYMVATAPNGKKLEISLDNFRQVANEKETEKLKSFIRQNSSSIPNLKELESLYTGENKKIADDVDFARVTDEMNKKGSEFLSAYNNNKKTQKDLLLRKEELNNYDILEKNSPEYISQKKQYELDVKAYLAERDNIQKTAEALDVETSKLNNATGKYLDMKSTQGSYGGAVFNEIMRGFFRDNAFQFGSVMANVLSQVMPTGQYEYRDVVEQGLKNEGVEVPKDLLSMDRASFDKWYSTLPDEVKDKIDKKVEDETIKEVKWGEKDPTTGKRKGGLLDDLMFGVDYAFTSKNTTPEFSQALKQDFWGGTILGLARSLPAMVGGKEQRLFQMYAQAANNVEEEMKNSKDFENVTEMEKWALTATIGVAVAKLEDIGFRNVIRNKGLLNKLIMKTLTRTGATTTTAATFGELIKNEVKSGIARGGLTVIGATLAEGETGFLQQGAEYGIKDIYSLAKEKKMFDTPETASDYLKEMVKAGAQEAIGSFVLGSVPAIAAAHRKNGFLGMDDMTFSSLVAFGNDKEFQKATVASLRSKVATGEMSISEAKETLNEYRRAVGLANALPDGLGIQEQKAAMNLIREKRDLERQIEGKESALTAPQRKRLAEITTTLEEIAEVAENNKNNQSSNTKEAPTTESKPLADGITISDAIDEDGEVDYEAEDAVRAIAKARGLGITRDREIAMVARDADGNVIGGAFTSFDGDNYTFDVVVNEENEGKGVGSALTDAVAKMPSDIGEANPNATMKVDVVNPAMQKMLEARGFEVTEQLDNNGRVLMQKAAVSSETLPPPIAMHEDGDISEVEAKLTNPFQRKVFSGAKNIVKSLKAYIPEVQVYMHETESSYNQAIKPLGGTAGSRGNFNVGRIDINLSKANTRTVAHEAAHAVLYKTFGDNQVAFTKFHKSLASAISSMDSKDFVNDRGGITTAKKYLNDFITRYKGDRVSERPEEYIAELAGLLSSKKGKLSIGGLKKVALMVREFLLDITGGKIDLFKDLNDTKEIVDFFNGLSNSFREGLDISVKDEFKNKYSDASAPTSSQAESAKGSKSQLLTDKKILSKMTEDGDGNFVFYHYSPSKIVGKIDPRHFGRNLKTGRDERPGIGISMYYTRPDFRDVSGDWGYVVRIPKENVYPFNEDPLNLYDKAKVEFEKMYPKQAFDPNKQVAFISQEAAKLGYDMTVAKWGKELRAQTTLAIKPEWYEKPSIEYGRSSVYNKKVDGFVANEKKGKSKSQLTFGGRVNIEGVDVKIPEEEKQKMLKAERTEKKYFDAKVQEMESSVLSKDELKAILDSDNMAILTGTNPDGHAIDDKTNELLNKKAEEWLIDNEYKYHKVTGKYEQTESSFIVEGMTASEAMSFAETFKQDSVAHSEGLVYRRGVINKRVKTGDEFGVDVTSPEEDNVSAIKIKGGEVVGFRIGYDFSKEEEFIQEEGVTANVNVNAKSTGVAVDVSSLKNGKSSLIETMGLERHDNINDRMTTGVTLESLGNIIAHLTFADRLVAGRVGDNEYFGGILFSAVKNLVWAAAEKKGVDSIIKGMPKNKDGYRYLMTALLSDSSHMSNNDMAKTTIDMVDMAISNKKISAKDANVRIKKAFSVRNLKDSYLPKYIAAIGKNKVTADVVISAMHEALLSDSSFDARKDFLISLLGGSEKNRFGGLPTFGNLAEGLAEPITVGHKFGDILLTIRTKGDLVAVMPEKGDPDYHPSYKWVIRALNPDGSRADVETLVFKEAYNATDVYPEFETKSGKKVSADDYKKKYGDNWKSRYLGILGASIMGSKVSRDIVSSAPSTKTAVSEAGNTQKSKAQLTEADLPGYNRVMGEVNDMIDKAIKRNKALIQKSRLNGTVYTPLNMDDVLKNVLSYVETSKAYTIATDLQREALYREVRAIFGKKEKTSPSFARLFGSIKNIAKVTMTEKKLLAKQLLDLNRGAKDAVSVINEVRAQIAAELNDIVMSGKLSTAQVASILRRYSSVNFLKPEAVDRFVKYMGDVFADADYAQKLSEAKGLMKKIAKLSKNKEKFANLREIAREFVKIDPSLVEDLDHYTNMATVLFDALKGSKTAGADVRIAEMANVEQTSAYTSEQLEEQATKIADMLADELRYLLDIDTDGLTYEELKEIRDSVLGETEGTKKYNEPAVRSFIDRVFGMNKAIIESMLDTGVEPLTGSPISFNDMQRDVIRRFLDMDLTTMSLKDALRVVDSMSNFMHNSSTSGMESILAKHDAAKNINRVINKGISAFRLTKYFSPKIGRLLTEQLASLPAMFERYFRGVTRGAYIMHMMGLDRVINGKAVSESTAKRVAKEYVDAYYHKKANGEEFNSEMNNIERGMAAFLMRSILGTKAQEAAEFKRRKGLIEESIEVLSEGSELEQKKAELYKEVFDRLVSNSESRWDVIGSMDATNLSAVNWWLGQWDSHYDQMSDVALNIYNKILGKDINYNPDRFRKLNYDNSPVVISNDDFAIDFNNGAVYKKESGSLMSASRPESLPRNEAGRVDRYIDLSFDSNNLNSLYDALVDINTASGIRQVEAFINHKKFKNVVADANDASIMKDRIKLYIANIRNKNPYSVSDEMTKTIRWLNSIAKLGAAQALGGITQPVKQIIPVAINTLINADGKMNLGAMFDPARRKFINNSGYAIATRGVESQAQIGSINKLIEEAAKNKGEKLMAAIGKLNEAYLRLFLVNPDVYIAKSSWISYYEQSLSKQGYDVEHLNYDTADYAQQMADRQQNISDPEMAGKLFSSKNEMNQFLVKLFMPFASFRINQSVRLANDLSVLTHFSTATKEDRIIAIKSLSGYAAETAAFKVISSGISIVLGNVVNNLRGVDESDEDKDKRINNIIRGQLTGLTTDILSPIPLLDAAIQKGVFSSVEAIQGAMGIEDGANIYDVKEEGMIKSLGMFGISVERAAQIKELVVLSTKGSFVDDYNKVRYIGEDDKSLLAKLIVPSILIATGAIPGAEVNNIIAKSIRASKKDASTKTIEKQAEDKVDAEKNLKVLKKTLRTNSRELTFKQKTILKEKISYEENKLSGNNPNAVDAYEAEMKAYNDEKKEEEMLLLGSYENREQMKNNAPLIYERKFGKNSRFYRKHHDKIAVQRVISQTKNGGNKFSFKLK